MGVTIDVTKPTGGGGGAVDSFNGRIGAVVPENADYNAGQITETATAKIMTDTERTKLSNQSGTNTGDETNTSVKAKYEANANTNAFTDAEKTKLGGITGTNTGDETTATIQSKRPLKTVNGNSLEGTGNVVVGGFDPNASKVLTKFKSATRDVIESTTSTTGQTYLTLVENAGNFPIGQRLRLTVTAFFSCASDTQSMFLRLLDFASQLGSDYRIEAKDSADRRGVTFVIEFTAQVANQYQISLRWGKISGGTVATMYYSYLEVQQIPS